jgi:hypothetical protein
VDGWVSESEREREREERERERERERVSPPLRAVVEAVRLVEATPAYRDNTVREREGRERRAGRKADRQQAEIEREGGVFVSTATSNEMSGSTRCVCGNRNEVSVCVNNMETYYNGLENGRDEQRRKEGHERACAM